MCADRGVIPTLHELIRETIGVVAFVEKTRSP